MRKITYLIILLLTISSCKSTKTNKVTSKEAPKHPTEISNTSDNKTINNIIETAETFNGVRYKYGGTTKKGMDCSGLVTTAYNSENISLPRTTGDLAITGDWVDVKEVQKGDLLFFATKKNSRHINHVGLVTEVRPGFVEFIHSTTSSGVITSKLSDKYWYFAFVQARRIL
jgi:cell wall-associated NlpC family hydrolase